MTSKRILTATMAATLMALGALAQDAKQAPAPALDAQQKAAMDAWQMGTGMATGKGQMDAAGTALSSTVDYSDPMTGKVVSMRQVMHKLDPDTESFEMYGPGPDGKEAKMMEMTYKRVK